MARLARENGFQGARKALMAGLLDARILPSVDESVVKQNAFDRTASRFFWENYGGAH
jgi:hypothetical protein